jgi:hypothetical protein
VLDVVQVHPAGLAAGEPAPAVIALAGGAADRGVRLAAAGAQGEHRAAAVVAHPGQGGSAGEHLRGGDADGRAVLDVAPGGVRGVAWDRRRFRGNVPARITQQAGPAPWYDKLWRSVQQADAGPKRTGK